jgi:hypothetical protein
LLLKARRARRVSLSGIAQLHSDIAVLVESFAYMSPASVMTLGVILTTRFLPSAAATAAAAAVQLGHNGAVNEGKLQLLEFLRGLTYKGRHLLINPNRLLTLQQLQSAVLRGDRFLDEVDEEVRGV